MRIGAGVYVLGQSSRVKSALASEWASRITRAVQEETQLRTRSVSAVRERREKFEAGHAFGFERKILSFSRARWTGAGVSDNFSLDLPAVEFSA